MAELLIINIDIDQSEMESFAGYFRKAGIHTDVLDLSAADISDCIRCGQCIKRNYCVNDEMVKNIAQDAERYDAFMFAADIVYGAVSEKSEHLLRKLIHSAGNRFSHTVTVPLFSCRSEERISAETTMVRYISSMGGILPLAWLTAEIHDEESIRYAADELIWLLSCLNREKRPSSQHLRNLQFTR